MQIQRLLTVFLFVLALPGPAALGQPFVAGEVLVKVRSLPRALSGVAGNSLPAGIAPVRQITRDGWKLYRLSGGMTVAEGLSWFRGQSWVVAAEPNYRLHLHLVPNDPLSARAYHLERISAPEAWNSTTGNSNIVVAILDTGMDTSHPDLAANLWRNPAEIPGNALDDDNNGYVDDVQGVDILEMDGIPQDDAGHGTHVAGIIGAAGNNGQGTVGICWKVSLLPVRIFSGDGSGSAATAAEALDYVVALRQRGVPVRIINCSWGGEYPSIVLREAFSNAEAAGILSVCSAGNEHQDNDEIPMYPAGYDSPCILSVAATSSGGELSSYSNFGRNTVHLAAPGTAILSSYRQGRYAPLSGTSMAAPMVSGAAALLVSLRPNLTVKQLRNLILNTVSPISEAGTQLATGGELNVGRAIAYLNSGAVIPDFGMPQPGTSPLSRVSTSSSGRAGNGHSAAPVVSSDGRYVAFLSMATNLVEGDVEGFTDVFLRDCNLGTTVRLSQNSAGAGGNGDCDAVVISADGSSVAFTSSASNLIPGDTRGHEDVFLYSSVTKSLELVSTRTAGGWPGGDSYYPAISADGRYVAFTSVANDIIIADYNQSADVFIRDRVNRTTGMVSYNPAKRGASGWSEAPSISPDGQYIAFHSSATDLAGGDSGTTFDVYLHHRPTGLTERVSISSSGEPAQGDSCFPFISNDVRYVLFSSDATNLDGQSTTGKMAVYLRDRVGGTTRCLSRSLADGDAWTSGLSSDGRFALFDSDATSPLIGGFSGINHFYLWDRIADALVPGPFSQFGRAAQDSSYSGSLSADGRYLAFSSHASNLLPGDGNAAMDVFLLDRQAARADLSIRSQAASSFVGEGLLGSAPLQRTVAPLAGDGTAGFDIQLLNAGAGSQAFRLTLTHLAAGWSAAVAVTSSGLDITSALLTNGWTTPALAEGSRLLLRVRLSCTHPQWAEATCGARIAASPLSPSGAADSVTAVATRTSSIPGLISAAAENAYPLPDRSVEASAVNLDGTRVVFACNSDQLVADDRNGAGDVFVLNRSTGSLALASRSADGSPGNQESSGPSLSRDGRWLAFVSSATNLVAADTNEAADAFVKDLQSGSVVRVSTRADGTQADQGTDMVCLSGSGRIVAFASRATNLAAADHNDAADIFVRDLQSGVVEWISRAANGDSGGNGDSSSPQITADGQCVLFRSLADNLGPPDLNQTYDVYLFDREAAHMELISATPAGAAADAASNPVSISDDGLWVTFVSDATDLRGARTDHRGVYVVDRSSHTVSPLADLTGPLPNGWEPWIASISPDGSRLIIGALPPATDDDPSVPGQIFLFNRLSKSWSHASVTRQDSWGTDASIASALSADNHWLLIETSASNLVGENPPLASQLLLFDARRFQPDAVGRRMPTSLWQGLGVITPDSQQLEQTLGLGQTHSFDLRLFNSSSESDSFIVSISPDPELAVSVRTQPAGNDLTASVLGAGWTSPVVTPESFTSLSVTLSLHHFGQQKPQVVFHVASLSDPRRVDEFTLVLLEDSDLDTMPDEWELARFLDLSTASALTDTDGDGMLDADEYRAGLDPKDPFSFLSLTCTSASATSPFSLHWTGQPGRLYCIETAAEPGHNFEALTDLIPGEAGESTFSLPPTNSHAVYRVRADLP